MTDQRYEYSISFLYGDVEGVTLDNAIRLEEMFNDMAAKGYRVHTFDHNKMLVLWERPYKPSQEEVEAHIKQLQELQEKIEGMPPKFGSLHSHIATDIPSDS